MNKTMKYLLSIATVWSLIFSVQAQAPNWSVNPGAYNYSMTATSVANVACVELTNDNTKIAAFVGNECRGVVQTNTQNNGRHLGFLLIYSNSTSGEKVKFKIYDPITDAVYDSKDSLYFQNNATVGSISSPWQVRTNHRPSDLSVSNLSIDENMLVGSVVGVITGVDSDPDYTPTFSLPVGFGDNAEFAIAGDDLTSGILFNYEQDSVKSIRLRVDDGGGCSYEENFTVIINDVNDTPSAMNLTNNNIDENLPASTLIGTLTSVDEDLPESHTYTLVAGTGSQDNSAFNITGNELKSAFTFDFETQNTFSIRVRTTDSGGAFYEEVYQITANDVNDAPTDITLSNDTIMENNPVGTFIGKLGVVDQDAVDAHTYVLTANPLMNNDKFSIQGDSLVSTEEFDYEDTNLYSIEIQVTDIGNLTFTKQFSIEIKDSNDAPTALALSFKMIQEKQPVGEKVGDLSTTDQDTWDAHTYSLVVGTGDDDNANFQINGNVLEGAIEFDFNQQDTHNIRIRTTDILGEIFEKEFKIVIVDINDAPTDITLSNQEIEENSDTSSFLCTISTTDEDVWDEHTYELVAGTGDEHNTYFYISNDSIFMDSVLNYENIVYHNIRLRTTDLFGVTFEKTFIIDAIDVNEHPILDTNEFSIQEDFPLQDVVGTMTFSDVDFNQTHEFEMVNRGSHPFNIDPETGEVILIDDVLDYEEGDTIYGLIIAVHDDGTPTLSDTLFVKMHITDAVENSLPLPSTNFISPNNDGKNDYFEILNVHLYKNFKIQIFNENGQVVFSKDGNYNNEFDGRLNGNPLPTGTYYYYMVDNTTSVEFKGTIIIVK